MEKAKKEPTQKKGKKRGSKTPANRALIETMINKNSEILYNVFFDRSNPDYVNGWNELHDFYMHAIQHEYAPFYNFVVDLERILNYDLRLKSVYLLFKKIVPTIDPEDFEPLALLYLAINNVRRREDYNLLCIFVQIASTRLKKIEENYLSNVRSRKGRIAHSVSYASSDPFTQKEVELINPLFAIIAKSKLKFSDGYREIMVDRIIENKDYLIKKIKDYKKKEYEKKAVDEINKLYSRLEAVQENKKDTGENSKKIRFQIADELLKIDRLEKHYEDRFGRWLGPEEYAMYVKFLSIKHAINLPILQDVFYRILEPWPIKEYMQECPECLEPLLDIPLSAVFCIITLCAKEPCNIDAINNMLDSNFGFTINSSQLASVVKLGDLEMSNPENPADPHQLYRLGSAGYDFSQK